MRKKQGKWLTLLLTAAFMWMPLEKVLATDCYTQNEVDTLLMDNYLSFSAYGWFERSGKRGGLERLDLVLSNVCDFVKTPSLGPLPSDNEETVKYSYRLKNYIENTFPMEAIANYAGKTYCGTENEFLYDKFTQKTNGAQSCSSAAYSANSPIYDPTQHGLPAFKKQKILHRAPLPLLGNKPAVDCREWQDEQFPAVEPNNIFCPTDTCTLTFDFNSTAPPYSYSHPHPGTDFANRGNPWDAQAYTPFPACVVDVYKIAERGHHSLGNFVILTTKLSAIGIHSITRNGQKITLDGDTFVTILLAHLATDSISVSAGEYLADVNKLKSIPVGIIGNTGYTNGNPHLHIEAQVGRINSLEQWRQNRSSVFDILDIFKESAFIIDDIFNLDPEI